MRRNTVTNGVTNGVTNDAPTRPDPTRISTYLQRLLTYAPSTACGKTR